MNTPLVMPGPVERVLDAARVIQRTLNMADDKLDKLLAKP